jgi:hypothetical protein
MRFKGRWIFAILAISFAVVLTVRAEDFWIKKPWTQWSKDECNKILQDSPWAKKWSKGEVHLTEAMPGESGATAEGAGGEKSPEIHYIVELRSALPIREATVRLQQIGMKYDKMTDAQKKEFDAKAEEFLKRTYDDVILVHVDYGSNVQTFEREMATYWKNIREDAVPVDFYLINERGDRISPAKFNSPRNGSYAFDLIFPRLKNNEPVIHEGDKSVSIQFVHPAVGTQTTASGGDPTSTLDSSLTPFGRERVLIQYKLDKMSVGGKLTY